MKKIITFALQFAPVAELVDASVSKTDICEYVPVRFRPGVHIKNADNLHRNCQRFFICFCQLKVNQDIILLWRWLAEILANRMDPKS